MRSLYLENLEDYDDEIILKSKEFHHLVNVIRIKVGENVNFFDENENVYLVELINLTKKELTFKILEKEKAKTSGVRFSVAVGKLKKEALDLSIKQLVEIGVGTLYIYESEYSQTYNLKDDRVKKIIISSMEQSNNYIFPKVQETKLDEILTLEKSLVYFSSTLKNHQKIDTTDEDLLIIIGPEGGLSEKEENLILSKTPNVFNLPTNILRASTAVSLCSGFVLGRESVKI